jgi:hypothetical protein
MVTKYVNLKTRYIQNNMKVEEDYLRKGRRLAGEGTKECSGGEYD